MVRPQASKWNKRMCGVFAEIVTAPVRSDDDPRLSSVGRTGHNSIYSLLTKTVPAATREDSRRGVSEVEMNKVLEGNGFHRVRFRACMRRGIRSDMYRFGRRWRNPEDKDDMEQLSTAWTRFTGAVGAAAVSFEKLTELLRQHIDEDVSSMESRLGVSSAIRRAKGEWVHALGARLPQSAKQIESDSSASEAGEDTCTTRSATPASSSAWDSEDDLDAWECDYILQVCAIDDLLEDRRTDFLSPEALMDVLGELELEEGL